MKARVIAFYLPQYHPIPENDKWWGKGFTEWTNVAKCRPLFKGHYQPHVPADLGFYDLRMPEIREEQAEMAKEAGIEGFCYWHYWFGKGKKLLERPFDEVLKSGKPDFPFCLGWANETWSNKTWEAKGEHIKNATLMEQTYVTEEYVDHFYEVLPAFKDKRYITVDGKPLFVVFAPEKCPNMSEFISMWRTLAIENGLKGVYFVGITANYNLRGVNPQKGQVTKLANLDEADKYYNKILSMGFDAVNSRGQLRAEYKDGSRFFRIFRRLLARYLRIHLIEKHKHKNINKHIFVEEDKWDNVYPTIVPNWDRSPRSSTKATIYTDSTPEVFRDHLKDALDLVKDRDDEHKLIFLKSWNEWGEGNHMEPDLKYGKAYLNVLKDTFKD